MFCGQTNVPAEFSLTAGKKHRDIFNEVEVDVVFTGTGGKEWKVPAFWTGGEEFRVRFAAPEPGKYAWHSVCSDKQDAGLHGQEGVLEVTPYEGDNPLYRRGGLRVAQNKRTFEHADGTPFFWLGDTWWMGLCKRLGWPGDFQTLTADRVAKGFSVIQIIAGLYPDMPAFDERGANEAGFPWDRDYTRINPAYFDMADLRIDWLVRSGLMPCIVACWGYFLPWMGVEKMKKHWRNLVARYGAYPVVWCLAGEGMMPYYLSTSPELDRQFQKKGWNELAVYLRQIDPYHHPITIHPGSSGRKELSVSDPALKHGVAKNTRVLTAITDGWRFKTDPANCGETQSWHRMEIDASWKPISITVPWTEQDYDYHGAAWYTVECAVSSEVKNPVHLFFHAVDGTAKVWINGNFVGEQAKSAHIMWDQPWALDISKQVASKKTVRITIKVVKDQFACGIYRPVEIREENDRSNPAEVPALSALKTKPRCELTEQTSEDVLDFDMLQTGHGDRGSLPNTVKIVSEAYRTAPVMPVINGEVCYEGIGEACRQEVQRMMFWASVLSGAAGHTYGANGIWQFNGREKPYGPSPHGMTWGNTPWEEACCLPGSSQLGIAKRLLERYSWWQFEPHPDWVEPGWTDDLFDLPYTCGRHDVPLAAGIPKKVRVIYIPFGTGLKKVKKMEKNIPYQACLFNPVNGKEYEIGPITADKNGDWEMGSLPVARRIPIFQDWVLVLERIKETKR